MAIATAGEDRGHGDRHHLGGQWPTASLTVCAQNTPDEATWLGLRVERQRAVTRLFLLVVISRCRVRAEAGRRTRGSGANLVIWPWGWRSARSTRPSLLGLPWPGRRLLGPLVLSVRHAWRSAAGRHLLVCSPAHLSVPLSGRPWASVICCWASSPAADRFEACLG